MSSPSSSSAKQLSRKRKERKEAVSEICNQTAPTSTAPQKSKSSSGTWQSLGVSAALSRSLYLRGFKNPTPIQRATLPHTLSFPPRDVLGMARTGSGKTLAYLIPLLERLQGAHATQFGARALILCPNRELALQIFRVGKDLSRGLSKSLSVDHRDLRWVTLMGGESLDSQFDALANNPDVIIATPGRFLHLIIEMDMDLKSLELVIYDEADRLFELGFETQLKELQHRLPASRHSLLFSATLPSSVAEFAHAGLNEPELIRLDAEHRINPDVKLAFLSMSAIEKEAALLILLRDIINISPSAATQSSGAQAIIFVSTKHHVEYISTLLHNRGYKTSHIYGSLDQVARRQQLERFRQRETDLLVVTDVAARGLDIPVLDHVVNYDFPSGVRLFVHRAGRTGRAGKKGTAWSLVCRDELPFVFDLELFLGTTLVDKSGPLFGTLPRDILDMEVEHLKYMDAPGSSELASLREVMMKGASMFQRSRAKASREAYRRAKSFEEEKISIGVHPVFKSVPSHNEEQHPNQVELLKSVNTYQPRETVFEVGARGPNPGAMVMKRRRIDSQKRQTKIISNPSRVEKAEHELSDAQIHKGYSIQEGSSFVEKSRGAILDLDHDEKVIHRVQKASQLKWNKKSKKFIKGDGVGSDNRKMIRGESGVLLPATFKSGRYAAWKATKRTQIPDVGQAESNISLHSHRLSSSKTRGGHGNHKSSLNSVEDVRKQRQLAEQQLAVAFMDNCLNAFSQNGIGSNKKSTADKKSTAERCRT